MDFWNRLIGGSGTPSASKDKDKAPPPTTPEQRLQKFQRVWRTLLDSWRNARENDSNSQELLRGYIRRLTDILIEEEKRSARLCMNYCHEKQMFIALSKIGETGSPAVIRECIAVFSTLVENEDEDFLGHGSFAQSLIAFLRTTRRRSSPAFEIEFAELFVELLFGIAAKIRLNPKILEVWFTSSGSGGGGGGGEYSESILDPSQKFAGRTNKDDFPLFYLLIEYVHEEGKVGDFARTGLLYIIEAASSSKVLEHWIVQSDLATLMASGLGALYSQLSRKLVLTYSTQDPPMILLLSDYSRTPPASGAESSDSSEFRTHLETFLSYLIFWQDVLEHCRSTEVQQTLLDHFQVLFLQQLLYPSLLESSDVDGGSAVAVLTYVRVVLDTLEHPDIIHLMLSYLLNVRQKPEPVTPSSLQRRKSLDLLTQVANVADNPSPAIYNLADLIMTSLASKSQPTVSSTLRLVSTLLRKHYPYTMNTLLRTPPVPSGAPARTIGAHNEEIEMLFRMVAELTDDKNATRSYEDHLKDCKVLVESHPTTAKFLGLKATSSEETRTSDEKMVRMHMHTLSPHDPFLRHLMDLLCAFFSNTVETNLVLTGVIIDLATCAFMRPEGWLLFDPATYEFDEPDDSDQEEQDELEDMEDELAAIMADSSAAPETEDVFAERDRRRLRGMRNARRRPRLSKPPPIIGALQELVTQIRIYRVDIPDLDDKLMERRRAFEFTEEINEALLSSPLPSPQPPKVLSLDPFNPRSLVRPSTAKDHPRNLSAGSGSNTHRNSRLLHRGASPIRGVSPGAAAMSGSDPSSPFGNHINDTTQRRIKILHPGQKGVHLPPPPEDDSREGSVRSFTPSDGGGGGGSSSNGGAGDGGRGEFTLSHLLTNIMILQEFILELAALTQVRASLFGDVKFA